MDAVTERQPTEEAGVPHGTRFRLERGSPLPLGATVREDGVNFAVVSRHATSVTLVLFAPHVHRPIAEFPLDPEIQRTGDVWHAFVGGVGPGTRYGFRMDRDPNENPKVYRFRSDLVLLDPYARAVTGSPVWGEPYRREGSEPGDSWIFEPRALVADTSFDWGGDRSLGRPLAESIIYELNVRGFTRHPSSGVRHPGTYAGLVEKIPYLLELGITAVELLPVHEFDELEIQRSHPDRPEARRNLWGYNSLGFFAPKASYASASREGAAIREFKQTVRAFHDAGIEVLLDVVYNHTGEGGLRGPTYHFKGIDNATYYIVDPKTGRYHNYSGCGNTVSANHPVVSDMILESLRYWRSEMHVDGFRFDLASIFTRDRDGHVLERPPLLERIAADPVLASTKLIAEAWDADGLYQVGVFPAFGRFAEWNGKFRDDVRRFVKGDAGTVPALAQRLIGSPDLYGANGRSPWHSVNYVTCHDGFTLRDLVSYNHKHNEANAEGNRDGTDANYSWNCGHEGETGDPEIRELRLRQMKNLVALLLLAHGTPMVLAGDEMGRSQGGNNNAYCQDNDAGWVDWTANTLGTEMFRFFRLLIELRKAYPLLRPHQYLPESGDARPGFTWHGVKLRHPDWSYESRSLALELRAPRAESRMYLAANAHTEALKFEIPRLAAGAGKRWFRALDTSLPAPQDVHGPGQEAALPGEPSYRVAPRSVVLLVAR